VLHLHFPMNNTQYILTTLIALLLGALPQSAISQLSQDEAANIVQLNTITTAVPFLLIAPDSRSGALGDAGVALSADANCMHWNPAKMAFNKNDLDVSLSYAPWLRALVDDMNLAYLTGIDKLNKRNCAFR